MAVTFTYPPSASGGSGSNASVGTNGVTSPTSSTLVAGQNPTGLQQPLQTDVDGKLLTALPADAATESKQDDAILELENINSSTLASSNSLSSIDGKLTGVATAANQATEITALNAINTKTPALVSGSVPVTGPLTDTQLRATPVPISGTVTTTGTSTVSGTVTVTQATGSNLHTVVDSGTLTANIGTTNGLALDASLTTLNTSVNTLLKPASTLAAVTTVGTVTAVTAITNALPTGSNVIGALVANQSTNVNQIAGTTALTGNGNTGAGSLRVTIAADNSTIPVSQAPSATSTNALSSAASTALSGSLIIKASAGRLYSLMGFNSSATSYYIQIHNSAAVPANGAVPAYTFLVPAASNFSLDFPQGRYFSTGIVVLNSTTVATKTVGSADCWFNAEYL